LFEVAVKYNNFMLIIKRKKNYLRIFRIIKPSI